LAERVALAAAAKALFNRYDLLLGPVMPCAPPLLDADAPPGFEPGDWRWCPFAYLWNMTGQPSASVPWGQDDQGLPIGVQLVGWVGREPEILRAARALEERSGPWTPLAAPRGPAGG
jgi:aspartyl-tRNA(Asn)/glutamyl-tRNA(Gln) amidotransferase subunit A